MKKLLRGLTVLFSIVLSIAGAYGNSGCPPNQYSVGDACYNCPTTFSSDLYEFVDYNYDGNSDDQNVTGQDRCTIKLIIGGTGSKCAAGTVVVYSYSSKVRNYLSRTANVLTETCVPDINNNFICALRKVTDPVRPNSDYCAECLLEDGEYYEDAEHRCSPCPDLNGGVGIDGNDSDMYSKLYAFIGHHRKSWLEISAYDDENHAYEYNAVYYGKDNKPNRSTLKASCAVEFNIYASSCPKGTNSGSAAYVEYDYNFKTGRYELIGDTWNESQNCDATASSCSLPIDVANVLDTSNVNTDLCGTCNFVGNYKAEHCPSSPNVSCVPTNGQYYYCKACPDVDFDPNLYEFVFTDDNSTIENCTIRLRAGVGGGSKCAAETNVKYVYNPSSGKYELGTFVINTSECTGGQPCYTQIVAQEDAGTFNGQRDFCGLCENVGNGKYINGDGLCSNCPALPSTLYEYTFVDPNKCTIKLKVGNGGSKCATGTDVQYTYNFAEGYERYEKTKADVITAECNPTSATGTCVLRKNQDPTDFSDYCVVCNVGNGGFYEDREYRCQACPNLKDGGNNDIIGSYDSNKLYKFLPYPNHTSHSSSNQYSPFSNHKDSCAVVLNVDQSFCDNGTSVQYVYKLGTESEYVLNDAVTNTVYVAPCTDASTGSCHFKNYDGNIPSSFDGQDLCRGCATNEYYDGTICQSCPECQSGGDCGTNDNENLYLYTGYGTGTGITSCAVKLNLNKSNCGEAPAGQPAAGVVYVYNGSKYVRTQNYKVYNGRGYVLPVSERPKDDVLKDYCSTVCNNGYYLNDSKCEICPAGYSCGDIGEPQICDVDSYSDAGASACTPCQTGYTTTGAASSSFCKDNGKGCSSPNACRAATDSASLCFANDCSVKWDIPAFIEVLSTNRYVTQTVTKPSTGN